MLTQSNVTDVTSVNSHVPLPQNVIGNTSNYSCPQWEFPFPRGNPVETGMELV